jgi:hypothetical protein
VIRSLLVGLLSPSNQRLIRKRCRTWARDADFVDAVSYRCLASPGTTWKVEEALRLIFCHPSPCVH